MRGTGHRQRVVVVIPSTQRRGSEIQGVALADGLRKRGWETEVVAVESGSGDHPLDVAVLGRTRRSLRGILRLRRLSKGATVVAHGSSSLVAVAVATWGTRTPWVYRNIGDPAAWVRGRLARLRTGVLMRRASGFAVLWPGAAESLRSLYRIGAVPMEFIPNDRDPSRFPVVTAGDRAAARAALELEGQVVLFLGALSHEKDPLLAVEAIARLGTATLLVAGDGALRSEVDRLASARAPGRVRMLGVIDDPERAIAASDVLALTSRTEGMPGAIIESLMRGVPVVATSVGAVSTMLERKDDGLVVAPSDVEGLVAALTTVLERTEDADTRLARSVRACAAYGPEQILDRWESLLGRVSGAR